ncbi:MAG TPA: alpha-L-fucosidase [Candidatus Merdivicinus intestinavium]|nr:alpha-L-fucosidase [Candidatus Merdivicinus intestinavium]
MQKIPAKTWEEIDARPIPEWFDRGKFGIFIHWGIYSVPAYAPKRSEVDSTGLAYAEWYGWQVGQKFAPYYDFHRRVYGENASYKDFASQWKAEMFNPEEWASLFEKAGAQYVVLVSKHHDAFCLWPSAYSFNWNSVDIGPHRDIVGELLDAVERHGMKRGLYYSLLEWDHPVMQVKDAAKADIPRYAVEKMIPQMKELVTNYRPSILFTDGEWSYSSEQWHSRDFLTWLLYESNVRDEIVINDRWGSDTRGLHGGYLTSEYGEVNSPAVSESEAQKNLQNRKWEENRSIGASFGFNRNENIEDYLGEKELIDLLINTVSRGGNLCLNVGPCADGTISPIIQERLLQIGDWLKINGEAIYGTAAGANIAFNDTFAATRKGNVMYLFCKEPASEPIVINLPNQKAVSSVEVLGSACPAEYKQNGSQLVISPWPAPPYSYRFLPYTYKISTQN